jgi:hypothetical protein
MALRQDTIPPDVLTQRGLWNARSLSGFILPSSTFQNRDLDVYAHTISPFTLAECFCFS